MAPPTLAGFQAFIANVMQIPESALPTSSPVIPMAFEIALAIVNPFLAAVSRCGPPAVSIYNLAVYNLAGDNVINYAPDQENMTFFKDLRDKWHIADFISGVVQSANDETTGSTLVVQEAAKNFTLSDLQNLKTPYGRAYLAFAQKFGTLWGLS